MCWQKRLSASVLKRRTADIMWCLVVKEESHYFYGPNNVWMAVCVPVPWLCGSLTDIIQPECAFCSTMRGLWSHPARDFYFQSFNTPNSSQPPIWQYTRPICDEQQQQYKCAAFVRSAVWISWSVFTGLIIRISDQLYFSRLTHLHKSNDLWFHGGLSWRRF